MLDEFRSTYITWDKATRRIYSPVTANESDSNGRKLNIQVVNSGQVENLTGATLHLYWETKDKAQHGLDAFKASDISKGEFEIFYTTGMLSNVGELNATLVLVDSTGKVVSDWFKITVARGIDNDAIQSENSFSSLTQALIDVSNLEQNYTPRLNDLTAQLQQTEQELNAQLAQTEGEFRRIKANPNSQTGAFVTFIDDNAQTDYYKEGNWHEIVSATGIKIGLAAVSDWVGTQDHLTVDQLKQLQDEGHEIYSHSKTHPIWDNLSTAQIREECSVSKYFLEDNGFDGSNILVYSNGINDTNTRVKDVVRQYYDYAITTDLGREKHNLIPVDNWAIQRMDADYSTLEEMKIALDKAIEDNGWLIFYSHSFNFTVDSKQKFIDFINYAKSLNVPIMPFKEASKRKGNVIAVGEKTSNTGKTFVSAEGKADVITREGFNLSSDETMTQPIDEYPVKTLTVKRIPGNNDIYFNNGGILSTHNYTEHKGYAFQTFKLFESYKTYSRYWDGSTIKWSDWILADQLQISSTKSDGGVLLEPITVFPPLVKTVIACQINPNSPYSSEGGIYTVQRFDEVVGDHYGYAEYKIYNSNALYRRYWTTGGAWSAWEKVSGV